MNRNAPPLIGVTRCSRLDDYITAIEGTGARTRVLEVCNSPRQLLGEVDGILLTGGADVDPVLYGERRHPATEDAEPGRDEFELDLARRVMDCGVPLLAICRGVQVLNVAAGGSLVQDIPTELDRALRHAAPEPKTLLAHTVTVEPGSRLDAALAGAPRREGAVPVNSRHHQAIARTGRGLTVTARAADGVVEGVEHPGLPFCVGVQWHPENFWASGEFRGLFDALVRAARDR